MLSSPVHTQSKRLLRLATPLGEDALIPLEAQVEEAMSQGFRISVTVASETLHELEPSGLLGKSLTLSIVQGDESERFFNGYVTEFAVLGKRYGGQRTCYRLVLRSWLYLLDKQSDCRVFQDMTVPQVLEEVLGALGEKASYSFDLRGIHTVHRYLTQYNETHANFVKRLLRMEGIGFVCEHEKGCHRVLFFDDPNCLLDLASDKALLLQSETSDHDHLSEWLLHSQIEPGHFTQRTYNYQNAGVVVQGEREASASLGAVPRVKELQQYRFSERYQSEAEVQRDTDCWMRSATERHQYVVGSGNYRHLQPGRHFTVRTVPAGSSPFEKMEFTFSRVSFIADDIEAAAAFTMRFEALPKGEMILPAAEQPRIAGVQTALVTGPVDSEIFTDRLGRVKVRFHWDRPGRSTDEDSTCWLRVMQPFAGPGFGAHFTPRVGQEVVVAFENGNPDRPFVAGSLYHPEHLPPYADRNGLRSGVRTRSSVGGDGSRFNELFFDDETGSEVVGLQAERDLNALIKHDETRQIGNDKQLEIGRDQTTTVGSNSTHSVQKKLVLQAGDSITLKVGGSEVEITADKIAIRSGVVDIDGGSVQIN